MRFYFFTITFALGCAALAGGAMLWDGSYYLYCALNSGHPCVSNNRWITLFLHFPVVFASSFIQDINWLRLIFGLTYALIPLLLLIVSWWMVRKDAPLMFIWAAFGLGFGTLLLQLHFVAEAIISVQLAWPLFLAQFLPGRISRHIVVSILAALLFVSHPFAIGVYALLGIAAFLVGWQSAAMRREKWAWGSIWIMLTGAAIARLFFASSVYEANRISFLVFQEGGWALKGMPGWALASVFVTAGLVFWTANVHADKTVSQRLRTGQLAGIFTATSFLLVWANDPVLWNSSFAYRILAFGISLPLFILAGADGLFSRRLSPETLHEEWPWRLRIVQTLGMAFALILCVQSWSWYRVQNRLLTMITQSPSACLSLEDISSQFGEGQMPFHHWSITTLSLFLQGNIPQKIITEKPCDQYDFSTSMPVNGWEVQPWGSNRVFDLRPLQERLKDTHSPLEEGH